MTTLAIIFIIIITTVLVLMSMVCAHRLSLLQSVVTYTVFGIAWLFFTAFIIWTIG